MTSRGAPKVSAKGKVRAVARGGTSVGPARYQLYRQGYAQINNAMKTGFYLEAIAIIESLVSDRLESRLSFLKGSDFGFKTLGVLIQESSKIETDAQLLALVTQRLDAWRKARNIALHEMVKLASGETTTWQERVRNLSIIGKNGLSILRAIDTRCKHLRKIGL